jgi:hypothetical protein
MCGTSIGAINAWFVATGQYSALRKAWVTTPECLRHQAPIHGAHASTSIFSPSGILGFAVGVRLYDARTRNRTQRADSELDGVAVCATPARRRCSAFRRTSGSGANKSAGNNPRQGHHRLWTRADRGLSIVDRATFGSEFLDRNNLPVSRALTVPPVGVDPLHLLL